jgi:hypothetical protein
MRSNKLTSLFTECYPLYRAYRSLVGYRDRWRYNRIVKRHNLPIYEESEVEKLRKDFLAMEMCQVLRAKHDWLDIPDYLVGGAADHKLIYLLARCLLEYLPGRVIEFGAGQSTDLLRSYARHNPRARVITIEDDVEWTARAREKGGPPNHEVFHCPLTTVVSRRFGTYRWYDLRDVPDVARGGFDLLLVDGPAGVASYSRVGIVERFPELFAGEWVLLWDDVHRAGDLESFAAFLEMLGDRAKSTAACAVATSLRSTGVVFTPAFRNARYYF